MTSEHTRLATKRLISVDSGARNNTYRTARHEHTASVAVWAAPDPASKPSQLNHHGIELQVSPVGMWGLYDRNADRPTVVLCGTIGETGPGSLRFDSHPDAIAGFLARLSHTDRAELLRHLTDDRTYRAERELVRVVRERAAELPDGADIHAVVFNADQYDDGFFLTANGAALVLKDGQLMELSDDFDTMDVSDALRPVFGRVAERAGLAVNLVDGSVFRDDEDRDAALAAVTAHTCGGCGIGIYRVPTPGGDLWRSPVGVFKVECGSGSSAGKQHAPAAEQTWTFCGHWEGSRIVMDYVIPGERSDDRIDTGRYEEGLWAASASGRTVEEAEAKVRAEYEPQN